MGLAHILIRLYPTRWRARYGDEFDALLHQTPLTPRVVVDILGACMRMHARVHRLGLMLGAAVVVSMVSETCARVLDDVPNILWTPTDFSDLLLLVGSVGPWILWCWMWVNRRWRLRTERQSNQ